MYVYYRMNVTAPALRQKTKNATGQIRNISRGLFPAMRHRFGFMQRCGGRLVFSSLAAVALAAASYARGLKKVCQAVVRKGGIVVKR